MGTINGSITHPREIFKEAYKISASSIVCMHNHPSGDVRPSKEDIRFTKSLVKAGYIQGIPILDHIIVGEDRYYSFYDNNILNL
jgi:DNA repair protein RadC